MNDDQILDSDLAKNSNSFKNIEILSINKFIILNIVSLGLYQIWWFSKTWKFFKEKDQLDIIPVARAIFGVIFAYSLFEKIRIYSLSEGYDKSFSSGGLYAGFVLLNILSRLPDPYWMISLFAFLCLIYPLSALNFAIENSQEYNAVYRDGFNTRQIVLIVIGTIFILLVVLGLLLPEEQYE